MAIPAWDDRRYCVAAVVPHGAGCGTSLDELRERFVLVGGAILELLITDPTVLDFRPTTDVCLVVEAATYRTYASVEQTLTEKGFTHVVGPGVPICRWKIGAFVADVMPAEESILGFGNRWYPEVVRTAQSCILPSGTTIRVAAPQYFLATKLEAFHERGNADAVSAFPAVTRSTLSTRSRSLLYEELGKLEIQRAFTPLPNRLETAIDYLVQPHEASARHLSLSGVKDCPKANRPTGLRR